MSNSEVKRVYKIRDKNSGLFADGGSGAFFSKKGKTWNTINNLNSHLSYYGNEYFTKASRFVHAIDPEIVEYEVVVTEKGTHSLEEWTDQVNHKRLQKEQKRALKNAKYQADRKMEEFLRLKKELNIT